MSVLRALLPAMALAAGAFAQSSCSTSGTLTVTATGDAASLAGCSTYSGSIAVATGATSMNIDGPSRITGDLVVVPGGSLTTLEANNLAIVDGQLSVQNAQMLQSITMPKLTRVTMFTLANIGQSLLSLGFGTPGLSQVTNLSIVDTYLQTLTGINLTTAGSVMITNNNLLGQLTMSLVNTTGDIVIRGNNAGLNVNLNNLKSAGAVLINDCSTVQMNSLANSTGLVALSTNSFQSLYLPNLTNTQGTTVSNNSQLSNLSLPLLTNSANLGVNGNPVLTGNITFPALYRVSGAVSVTGNFAGVFMPMLNRVMGTFAVISNQSIASSCSIFNSDNGVFSVSPTCSPVSNAAASQTSGGSGSSATSKSAAMHYGPSENAFGIFGVLAAIVGLLM